MSKKAIIPALIAVLTLTTQTVAGQVNYQVMPQQALAEDYVKLLNAVGYQTYSFDISSLADSTRILQFLCREYDHGTMVGEKELFTVSNRIMISDFDEDDQKTIHESGMAYDEANDVLRASRKVLVGFTPLKNDSTERASLEVEDMGHVDFPLTVRPAVNTKTGDTNLDYKTRPFKVPEFQFDTFMPLCLYGSMWYDERFDIFRFCGEIELDPDMSSDMLKDIPHYYVIGVKVQRK